MDRPSSADRTDLSPQSGCDGIKVDEKGNIYALLAPVPPVYSPDGKRLATVTLPSKGAFLLNVNWSRKIRSHRCSSPPATDLQDRDEEQGRGVGRSLRPFAPTIPLLRAPLLEREEVLVLSRLQGPGGARRRAVTEGDGALNW
jgi:hypothetical protein